MFNDGSRVGSRGYRHRVGGHRGAKPPAVWAGTALAAVTPPPQPGLGRPLRVWWGFWRDGPVSQQDPSPGSERAGPSGPTSAAVRLDHGLGCGASEHEPSVDQLWLQLRPHGFSGSLSQAVSQGQLSGRFQGLLWGPCVWAGLQAAGHVPSAVRTAGLPLNFCANKKHCR